MYTFSNKTYIFKLTLRDAISEKEQMIGILLVQFEELSQQFFDRQSQIMYLLQRFTLGLPLSQNASGVFAIVFI